MINDMQHMVELVLAVSVFALVLSIWIAFVLIWAGRRSVKNRRLKRRLGLQQGQEPKDRRLQLWQDGEQVTTVVPDTGQPSWRRRFDAESRRAGWELGGEAILLIVGGLTVASTALTFFVTTNIALAVGVGVALLFIFRIYLKHRISRRDAMFERQLVDSLELAARSLRAGHPLMGALHLVSEEMSPPVSKVFGEICQEHEMGSNLEEVLRGAADRTTNTDMKLFATSVAIQARSGGNLANLMDRLASVIRQRIRLNRRVRILTAQTQMSKRVLLILPFVVFLGFSVLNPDYMDPFYTTKAGRLMLGAGLALLAAGAWVMNRMASLKY